MINPTNSSNNGNTLMEAYDRPISTYDNLNMTANMNTITTTANSGKPIMAKAPTIGNTNTTPPSLTETNGAAHSTPFTNISFKLNKNHTIPHEYQQQLEMNGNRNLNEIPPNACNATVYATPHKTSVTKAPITTVSPLLTAQQHSLSIPTTTATTQLKATETNTLISSPSLLHTTTTPTPTAAVAAATTAERFSSFNRPLSQHSQSELNDTSHSIAAVKAALNEAKSKFFGLNGYTPAQQQLQDPQHNYDDKHQLSAADIQRHLALIPNIHPCEQQQPQQQQQQQQLVVQKPQPKYQNIPENSAIFRNRIADGADNPPDLPPKPVDYKNFQQPTTSRIQTSTPDHHRKMPVAANASNQISLNDIHSAAARSQTVYMATTVPQNLKGNKIAGRHTPTRSSLRHSRMLVVNNKNYEEVQHPNPMGFQQPNLARWLLILQIVVGVLLISLSTWIFFLTPSTPLQDNPYWCGLVLLITGIVGLIIIRYQRSKRAKAPERCFMFLRMDSYVLSLLSVVLCCAALIFAAIHYCRLTAADTKCKSMQLLVEHGSCICTFNAPSPTVNTTEPLLNESVFDEYDTNQVTDNSYSIEYRDLSCKEVTGPWTSILGLSFILNALGLAVSLAYIVLLVCCRRPSKRLYTTVRTSTF